MPRGPAAAAPVCWHGPCASLRLVPFAACRFASKSSHPSEAVEPAIGNGQRAASAAEAASQAAAIAAAIGANVGSAAAAPIASMASNVIDHKLKYPEPPKPKGFQGDPRRPPDARSFLFQLDNYFAGWAELNDVQKNYLPRSTLKVQRCFGGNLRATPTAPFSPSAPMQHLRLHLITSFEDLNNIDRARHELAMCRQTASIKDYLDRFRAICFPIPAV